jgi:hypothetical protein
MKGLGDFTDFADAFSNIANNVSTVGNAVNNMSTVTYTNNINASPLQNYLSQQQPKPVDTDNTGKVLLIAGGIMILILGTGIYISRKK